MAIGGISGKNGYYPSHAAAQYDKNATIVTNDTGKINQAKQQFGVDKFDSLVGQPPGAIPSGEVSDGGTKKSDVADDSSINSLVYDPRDTNRDGKVSLQEEIAYAAKKYSSGSASARNSAGKTIHMNNSENVQQPRASSINVMA